MAKLGFKLDPSGSKVHSLPTAAGSTLPAARRRRCSGAVAGGKRRQRTEPRWEGGASASAANAQGAPLPHTGLRPPVLPRHKSASHTQGAARPLEFRREDPGGPGRPRGEGGPGQVLWEAGGVAGPGNGSKSPPLRSHGFYRAT